LLGEIYPLVSIAAYFRLNCSDPKQIDSFVSRRTWCRPPFYSKKFEMEEIMEFERLIKAFILCKKI
jgi:deoxyribodipyrimidine photo-lyase